MRNVGQFSTNVVPYNFVTNDAAFTPPLTIATSLTCSPPHQRQCDARPTLDKPNQPGGVVGGPQRRECDARCVHEYLYRTRRHLQPDIAAASGARSCGGFNDTKAPFPPAQFFRRLGDVLATPELTMTSPFLSNRTNLHNDSRLRAYTRNRYWVCSKARTSRDSLSTHTAGAKTGESVAK